MTGMLGADVAALQRLALEMGSSADQLERIRALVGAKVKAVHWGGADALAVRADWENRLAPFLANAAAGLREAERALRAQSTEQIEASGGETSARSQVTALLLGLGLSRGMVRTLVAEGGASLAERLIGLGDKALSVAGLLDKLETFSGTFSALGRLAALNSAATAFTGSMLTAGEAFRNVGGKVPVLGSVLTVTEIAWNCRTHGLNTPETNESLVLGPMGLAASFVAGPMGGVAWTGGTMIGKVITDHTSVDEVGAEAAFATAYGDGPLTVAEAARVVERTNKPWLFAKDYVVGGVQAWLR